MPCFHPLNAVRGKDGGIRIGLPASLENPDGERLRLPCGGCLGCRKARAREWAIRCKLEAKEHTRLSWGTLTYDDQHVPLTLRKADLQLFFKRLRRRVEPRRVRFFASGEYGEQTQRPHYHPILFGLSPEDLKVVQECWPFGFVRLFELSDAAIAYVAGYCSKKIGWRLERQERIDYSTGEVYEWEPPFVLMSRRPGIGGHARQFVESWRRFARYNGKNVPVPRFLHEAWKSQATDVELEDLASDKFASRVDSSFERLQAAEHIERVRHNLSSQRRLV